MCHASVLSLAVLNINSFIDKCRSRAKVIGVLCEVVGTVTAAEKEESEVNLMKQTILIELKKFDDGDGTKNATLIKDKQRTN